MTFNYTLSELSTLGITDISITYRSLESDTVSMRCPLTTATTPPISWTDGDRIIISDDGSIGTPRLFNGRVKSLTTSISGGEYALGIELANAVDVLNSTIYAAGYDYGQSFYDPRATGESTSGERITSSRTVCERCFDYARSAEMDCSRDVRFNEKIMGIAGTGSQSCLSLILAALRWVPDACTAMRYSDKGDVLQFLVSRGLDSSTISATAHTITASDGTHLGTFEGIASCELRPRHDLVPPVCALTGRQSLVLPDGGDLHAPGAFIYHIRKSESEGTTTTAIRETAKKQAKNQIKAAQPWQIVRGLKAHCTPSSAMGDVSMMTEASGNKAEALAFWRCFGDMALLRTIGADNLHFGQPFFEAVNAADAFPPVDNMDSSSSVPGATPLTPGSEYDDVAPTNYEIPSEWTNLYLFWSGRFPASGDRKKNISGFKWCRGVLSQYVWVTSLPSGVNKEKFFEFFEGEKPFLDGAARKTARYTKLRVEGIWLNVGKKKYQENVDQAETEPSEPDPLPLPNVPEAEKDPDYSAALRCYYAATRKLYYDGSIVLTGISGNPGALLATGINIKGLLPDWSTMATPCDEIVYDPIARRATLTVGSREGLTMDELVQRQDLGRQQAESRRNGATTNPEDATPDDPDTEDSSDNQEEENGDSEKDEEEDDTQYISPNISASHAADKKGEKIKAWEAYAEGDRWILNGGITQDGIKVEPMDITEFYKAGRTFYYKANKDKTKVLLRWKDPANS